MTDIEWAMVHYDGNNDEPYADLVVDALREKMNRSIGCRHCRTYEKTPLRVFTENGCLSMETKYCPMCGRKF